MTDTEQLRQILKNQYEIMSVLWQLAEQQVLNNRHQTQPDLLKAMTRLAYERGSTGQQLGIRKHGVESDESDD
jgi:hypothetical protein